MTILQVTTNEPPGTRERAPGSTEPPENASTQTEHPSNQEEKATAQGITPRRLRRYGKRKPPEEEPGRNQFSNKLHGAFLIYNLMQYHKLTAVAYNHDE